MAKGNTGQDHLPIETQIRTVTNPLNVPFTHTWGGTPFTVEAGKTQQFPGHIAIHLAKHLADFILINLGRFHDILRGDKLVAQTMTRKERGEVMQALLDRETSVDVPAITSEIKEVVQDFKGKKADKPELIGEIPLEKGEAEEVAEGSEEAPAGEQTPEERFAELKEIGWMHLDKGQKKEYSSLKNALT
jgi:hypothetical protein